MNAKEKILKAITANKPSLQPLPDIHLENVITYTNIYSHFKDVLESIGGKVIEPDDIETVKNEIEQLKRDEKIIVNTIPELGEIYPDLEMLTPHALAAADKAYIKATVGVAENGAVWLYETEMKNRLLPFICQHLVVLLDRKNIVATMHQAYLRINTANEGFGVFIAGPSKTADIEQSLVIGAHGPKSMTIYMTS
ncbi:LUD domain-containing protein [soil metagenome]